MFLTPRGRVFRRINGKTVDKIPNLNIIMTFAVNFVKVPCKKYVTNFRYLVGGNIECCEKFNIIN